MSEPVDVDQLRQLHEAATDAPWAWEMTGDKDNTWGVGLIIDDDDQPVVGRNEPGENLLVEPICDGSDHPADAELIATMRNALPTLLDAYGELTDLRAGLAVAHDVIRRLRDGWQASFMDLENPRWFRLGGHPGGDRYEPMSDAERVLLDAVAGPNDTEENDA